ncbi:alpha/beta fold hydrolase [Methylobacterium sp. J-070]|uniref:alpha/beta fold hydrolase n=1 Tax=Methylobacterium sp. J-070 TaxID=2836650 RepID=UPI001FBA6BB2|nr:alpha/beta hydrolase [Methylobacterium sp. J-070]MCJ2048452.1 alpha/beta hydrolase [Methylobacterium sp. J-070]
MQLRMCRTAELEIAYEESGPPHGFPVVFLHGFPDDPRTWDGIVERLAGTGIRTIAPYLRGYGHTRFLEGNADHSGQQAALGKDLLDLIDALGIEQAGLVGYDWGGRAACIAAALWPERVRWLVSIGGYHIQDIASAHRPAHPKQEFRFWYQWYFGTERGAQGLTENRHELCKLLWQLWSPNLRFTDDQYIETSRSFDNIHFVDVVLHCYRHRYRLAPGSDKFASIERKLAERPRIAVPSIVLHGGTDGCKPPDDSKAHDAYFTGPYERRIIDAAGHILSREDPAAVTAAILELIGRS